MKKRYLFIFILIVLSILIVLFFLDRHNLIFISESDKQQLIELLGIGEAPSFKPLYKKYGSYGIHGSNPNYYEISFKISLTDYEKNRLDYPSYKLGDGKYSEFKYKKRTLNGYICKIKISSRGNNKELFDRINKVYASKRREKRLKITEFLFGIWMQ